MRWKIWIILTGADDEEAAVFHAPALLFDLLPNRSRDVFGESKAQFFVGFFLTCVQTIFPTLFVSNQYQQFCFLYDYALVIKAHGLLNLCGCMWQLISLNLYKGELGLFLRLRFIILTFHGCNNQVIKTMDKNFENLKWKAQCVIFSSI